MLFLGFSIDSIMSSANGDSFTSFFSILTPFTLFPCPIAVTRIPNTMLDKHAKSRHPCLVSFLRGSVFSFSLLSIKLVVGLTYMSIIILRYVSSLPTSSYKVYPINNAI